MSRDVCAENRPNDEGDENDGLVFGGCTENGASRASAALLFDQFRQDQTVGIMDSETNGRRSAGLHVWDRPDTPIVELAEKLLAL